MMTSFSFSLRWWQIVVVKVDDPCSKKILIDDGILHPLPGNKANKPQWYHWKGLLGPYVAKGGVRLCRMKTWNRWANKPGDRPPTEPEFSDESADEHYDYEEESEEEEPAPDDEEKSFENIRPDEKMKNKTAKRVKK